MLRKICPLWLALVSTVTLTAANSPSSPTTLERLQCEYWSDPLGLDLAQPQLGWIMQSSQFGERQTAYQILAASTPRLLAQDRGDLWDSGQVGSSDTLGIVYAGKPLASGQQVFWKVRAWDQNHQALPWSSGATWTMGVLHDTDWHAQWIGAPAGPPAATYLLARRFVIQPGLRRATVNVCGLGQYEMSLNGKKVGDDLLTPGWSEYDKTDLYDTYDVIALLRVGENKVGVLLGNGMYNNSREVVGDRYSKFTATFGPPKAIAQLRLEYENGQVEFVGTDAQWRIAAGPMTYSSEYGGEDYDARLEPVGWNQPGFDDSTWWAAVVVSSPGGQLRGLSAAAPALRAQDVFAPVTVTQIRPGVAVYDLGQNAALMPRLQVHGPAGAKVRMIPAETLRPDGTVDRSSTGNKPAYWQYTLKGDSSEENWFPKFFYHGCRYLQVELSPGADQMLPTVDALHAVVVHSSSPPTGEFTCSNNLFNQIATLIRWAQRSNLMSVLTDCPHRERLGWLEQDYLNGPSLRYEFNLVALMNKAVSDMTDSQLANGLVPSTAPEYLDRSAAQTRGPFGDSPEWGSALVQCAWQQYQWTGDLALLRRNYSAMKKYASYLSGRAVKGIVNYGLGDWYDLGPKPPGQAQLTPKSLTGTAILYDDLRIMEQVARLLGQGDDAAGFANVAEFTRTAFQQTFYHPEAKTFSTGSQTANAMAVALGLADQEQIGPAVDAIVKDIRSRGNSLTSGDIGYRYLLRALAQSGRSDVIFDMNNQSDRPGYGYMLAHGATSLTEAWDARPASSQDHFMLGHIMEWFYHDLAGIQCDPDGPGFAKIIIAPTVVGDLTAVHASYDSVHGKIESEWHRAGNLFTLRVVIPANTTAMIHLPGAGVASAVNSGTYNFSCILSAPSHPSAP